MEVAQPPTGRDQGCVGVSPPRPRALIADGAPVEVSQNFLIVVVDPEHARGTGEPDRLQVTQQRMHCGRLRTGPAPNSVADPDRAVVTTAGQACVHDSHAGTAKNQATVISTLSG